MFQIDSYCGTFSRKINLGLHSCTYTILNNGIYHVYKTGMIDALYHVYDCISWKLWFCNNFVNILILSDFISWRLHIWWWILRIGRHMAPESWWSFRRNGLRRLRLRSGKSWLLTLCIALIDHADEDILMRKTEPSLLEWNQN